MSIPRVPNRPSNDLVRRQAEGINRLLKNTNGLSSSETAMALDRSFSVTGNVDVTGVYKVAGTQVVRARITGWTAATGTPARGAYAAAAAGTASVGYVQAELQGALNRIAALEARLIAYDADLRTHGLIGT